MLTPQELLTQYTSSPQDLDCSYRAGERSAAFFPDFSLPRTTMRLDHLWERIGRRKAQSRGIGQHYAIELVPDATGTQAIALHYRRQPVAGSALTHPGVYCLRSSETDWDAETLWRTYSMLTDLEAVFRSLKSELGLRPVFHHKEAGVDGHLFITVLAYQFVQILRRTLQDHGIQANWTTLRQWLSSQVRVTAVFQRPDGHAKACTCARPPAPRGSTSRSARRCASTPKPEASRS